MIPAGDSAPTLETGQRRLSSWKEIGAYLGCDARTAQRWEKSEGLPVHRHKHNTLSSVYAYPEELEKWRAARHPEPPPVQPVAAKPPEPRPISAPSKSRVPLLIALVLVLLVAAGAFLVVNHGRTSQPDAPIPQPLTTFLGAQTAGAFSPDGAQVAFTWNGEPQNNFDIYVMTVGSSRPLRLTRDPADDYGPAWSPDGRTLAFVRARPNGAEAVMLMPALGGPERVLAVKRRTANVNTSDLDWSPDGRWLVAGGLVLISAQTGESTPITRPPRGLTDLQPAFAPDGKALVFIRNLGEAVTALWTLPLADSGRPAGEARPLPLPGFEAVLASSPRWTPDGRDILFVSNRGGLNRIWRVAREGGAARVLAGLGERVTSPAFSRRGSRLVYSRRSYDTNIWRVSVPAPRDTSPVEPRQFIASTRTEDSPQYSPDGKRIAFVSMRSGYDEIWIADRDGSNPAQLTDLKANTTGSPRWSPDSRHIAFDSRAAGQPEIYVMPADGGAPRRLTENAAADVLPHWSPDGAWIYFASNRGGDMQIWKLPASGGAPSPVTRKGGFASAFSCDGKWLYFTRPGQHSPLWKMPAGGGDEIMVAESIYDRGFAPAPDGLFVLESREGEPSSSLIYYPVAGRPAWIARISRPLLPGLTVSPDGRDVLFAEVDQNTANLMLIENFR